MARTDLPAGTVTFLFTDVEGSTRLLHSSGEAAYADALAEHRRLLREAFSRNGGVEVDTEGDAFFVAFPTAPSALEAAEGALAALAAGPIRVRMGVHTGTPLVTDEGYVGVDVHRAARIAAIGHGDQVLVSATTASLIAGDIRLMDLGEHRLKDLPAPERIYQLGDRSFPPLKSLSPSDLPIPATPFIGRESEVARISAWLEDPETRLLTVAGPGGIGKTRLALQAANEAARSFPGGLRWVALASLREPSLLGAAVAQVLAIREDEEVTLEEAISRQLGGRRTLLLLDNAEHLLPELADRVALLLQGAPSLTLLVTSRERLRLGSERLFEVPEMSTRDAEAFFLARAAAVGAPLESSDTVTTLCERLDRLPLALQLAAARLRLFSPEQLLERLSDRLDLLTGERDADPRQRTLRSTIEWSHDLLSDQERTLLRRFAVFVGGSTVDAAQAVCETEIGTLEALLDKALLQRRDDLHGPRFWMLESIRGFAAERLDASGEGAALRARHAAWYRGLTEATESSLRSGDPEEIHVPALEADIDNLRAAMSFGMDTRDRDLARSIVAALPTYWLMRGRYAEARLWLERALEIEPVEDDLRRRLLSSFATVAALRGDHAAAVEASDAAAELATRLGGATERLEVLREQAAAAWMKGDRTRAEELYEEAFQVAVDVNNGVRTSACRLNLATLANETGRHNRAEELLQRNLPFVRARGQSRCEATTLALMAETSLHLRRADEASGPAGMGAHRAAQIGDEPLLIFCLELMAAGVADEGDLRRAALILGATDAARRAMDAEPDEQEAFVRAWTEDRLAGSRDRGEIEAARDEGGRLDLRSVLLGATHD